jgi:acetyl esterase/lipase
LVHGGGFDEGDPQGGAIETIAAALVAEGYYVAIPTYRLAPWGLITNQVCHDATHDPDGLSGRPPEQSDDIEAEVIALRADSHCNGKVGVVGGSGGGSWAVWAALDTDGSGNAYPFWDASKRADCAVSISGAYEFDDRTPEDYGVETLPTFIRKVENYTNTTNPQAQHEFSPVALVTTPSEQFPFKPIFLINSIHDFMPYHQIVDMICELEAHSVPTSDYQVLTIPGNSHSFAIWFDWDGIQSVGNEFNHNVGYHVIVFLEANLK